MTRSPQTQLSLNVNSLIMKLSIIFQIYSHIMSCGGFPFNKGWSSFKRPFLLFLFCLKILSVSKCLPFLLCTEFRGQCEYHLKHNWMTTRHNNQKFLIMTPEGVIWSVFWMIFWFVLFIHCHNCHKKFCTLNIYLKKNGHL